MVFFRDKVGGAINNNYVKGLILVIFGVYLLGAGYGLTQIQEGLERRKLSKEDSYSVKFFDLEDEFYREFPYRMQVIVTGDLNYSDPVSDNIQFVSHFHSIFYFGTFWMMRFVSSADGAGKIRGIDAKPRKYIVRNTGLYGVMASLIFKVSGRSCPIF